MQRFERPERLPPELQTTRYYLFDGGCVTYEFDFDAEADAALLFAADSALAFQPRRTLVDDVRRAHQRAAAVRRRRAAVHRRRLRPGRDAPSSSPRRSAVVVRVVLAVAIAAVIDRRCRCGCSACAAAGRRRSLAGVIGWGCAGAAGPRPGRLGLGGRRPRRPHASPSASRPRWRPPSRSTCSPGRARWPPASGPGWSSRRARSGPSAAGSTCSSATASSCGSPGGRGSGRCSRAGGGPSGRPSRPGSACAGCSRTPAACTSSSARSRPPASTSSRPRLAAELAKLQNRVAARAGRADPARPRGRARRHRRRGVRGVRLGAAGRGLDRPDLPRPAAHRRAGRGEGPAARASRTSWSGTSPRSRWWPTSCSGAPRSGRACARGRCSTSSPAACGPSSTSAARPTPWTRWRRCSGRTRRCACPQVYASCAPAGCSCRSGSRASRSPTASALAASGDRPRRARPSELLRSMLEQVLRIGFFHADPHPGNIFVLDDGTLGLIDFGAVGRLDPIQQTAMVDIMAALVRRDVSLLRDGIERVAEMAEAVPPERLERAFARLMADHMRPDRRRRSVDPAGPRRDPVGVRHPPARRPRDPVAGPGHARRHAAASSRPGVSLVGGGDRAR